MFYTRGIGVCSASCGSATRQAFRRIVVAPLHGGAACPDLIKTIECTHQPSCPIDCVVSDWSFYDTYADYANTYRSLTASTILTAFAAQYPDAHDPVPTTANTWGGLCSSSCGSGLRNRFRLILTEASHGGKTCPPTVEAIPCNTQACPSNCVVSEWVSFSSYEDYTAAMMAHSSNVLGRADYGGSCTKSCGSGSQSVYRYIISRPTNGGVDCPVLSKTVICNTNPCPQDCVVSQWSYYDSYAAYHYQFHENSDLFPEYAWYGVCSRSCGGGVRSHFRSVLQYPQYGGRDCPALTKTVTCNTLDCPQDCVVCRDLWLGIGACVVLLTRLLGLVGV
jgi:hypothetical protein